MSQRSLADIVQRMVQAIVAHDDDRGGTRMSRDDPYVAKHRRRRRNRQALARIAFNLALLFLLAGIGSNEDHAKAFERLLLLCSNVSCLIAVVGRERWSPSVLNRWDEALIFTTVALGLRVFA